jgi:hypothetical protein
MPGSGRALDVAQAAVTELHDLPLSHWVLFFVSAHSGR